MPRKVRIALLTTLLEWNIETAATLEFLSFEHQLQLVQFYLNSRRNFWKLDERNVSEQKVAIQEFFDNKEISTTAKQLVKFLHTHLKFVNLQSQLQNIIMEFEEIYRNAPFYWETPELFPQIIILTCEKYVHQFNLA